MWSYCTQYLQFTIIYNYYALPIICALPALSMLLAIYIYIKAYISGHLKISTPRFYVGALFIGLCFLSEIAFIITVLLYCRNMTLWNIFYNIFSQLYSIVILMLLGILYHRLYTIFEQSSSLAVSKCTNISFWTYYALTITIIVSGAFFYANNYQSVGAIIITLAGVLVMALLVLLDGLFIYKLFKVYNTSKQHSEGQQSKRQKLMKVITKHSMLAFISTSMSPLIVVFIILSPMVNSVHWDFVRNLAIIAAIYIDFMCVFLAYGCFHKYYAKLCGCCDVKCQQLWTKSSKNEEEIMTDIQQKTDECASDMSQV